MFRTVNKQVLLIICSLQGRGMLEAFSLRRNVHSLLDTETPRHDIPSLHGIRALNAVGLLLSHKQMALLFLPFVNRTSLAQVCCVVVSCSRAHTYQQAKLKQSFMSINVIAASLVIIACLHILQKAPQTNM